MEFHSTSGGCIAANVDVGFCDIIMIAGSVYGGTTGGSIAPAADASWQMWMLGCVMWSLAPSMEVVSQRLRRMRRGKYECSGFVI
jgi:hypothetical protein